MSEWRKLAIEQIADCRKNALATGPFGSAISARFFTESGVPVIRGSNLSLDIGKRLLEDDMVFISEELASKFERSSVQAGDLIFTCWGTIGQVGLIDAKSSYNRYIVSNKQMKVTPNPALADPLFLYYAFSNPSFVQHLQSIGIGSSVPGFNLGQLRSMTLTLPPSNEQEAIVAVLGALDDKITINDRIARIADDLIRARYDECSLEAGNSIEIGRLGTLIRETVAADLLDGTENYIALEHMPRRNMWLSEWETSAGIASVKTRFQRGDILFGKLRPYFHKVGIAFVGGVSSTDIFVIRPGKDSYRGWLLASLASDDVVAHASAVGDGTRMPRARWRDLATYEVPWIGFENSVRFNAFVAPLADRVSSACAESQAIAELRDTLLPRLMSGEIQVREAEKIVEEVT